MGWKLHTDARKTVPPRAHPSRNSTNRSRPFAHRTRTLDATSRCHGRGAGRMTERPEICGRPKVACVAETGGTVLANSIVRHRGFERRVPYKSRPSMNAIVTSGGVRGPDVDWDPTSLLWIVRTAAAHEAGKDGRGRRASSSRENERRRRPQCSATRAVFAATPQAVRRAGPR